jgi:hypothetical protein
MKNILASNSTKLIPINELKLANSNRLVTWSLNNNSHLEGCAGVENMQF